MVGSEEGVLKCCRTDRQLRFCILYMKLPKHTICGAKNVCLGDSMMNLKLN